MPHLSCRASSGTYKVANSNVDDDVAEATSSLLKAELRHHGRDVLLHGRGVSRKLEHDTKRELETDERKLDEQIEAASKALQAAEAKHGTRVPVSPPSEPLVWSARLKERPRNVTNISISR